MNIVREKFLNRVAILNNSVINIKYYSIVSS